MKLRVISHREAKRAIKIVVVRERSNGRIIPEYEEIELPKEKVLHFDAAIPIEGEDAKKFDVIKDGDKIADYQNVKIKGYLSTNQSTTPSDRDGEYVLPGAFKETIPSFMKKNPVILMDHSRDISSVCGRFTKMIEDSKGLYVEGELSNAPDCRDVRFKVAEGFLRTMSMGGIFYYAEDGRAIFKVALWEGSLVALPANPDAIISTRSLTSEEQIKCAREQFAKAA